MMDLKELIRSKQIDKNIVKGMWYLIQWSPDSYSRELFNIGVGFISNCGKKSCVFTNNFKGLSIWYGSDIERQADIIKNVAKITFESLELKDCYFENNIKYDPMGFAQGASSKEILNRLFKEVVFVGREKKVTNRTSYTTTKRVISLVKDNLSSFDDIDAGLFMPENPMIETSSGIPVNIPIQYENNAGTIISADFGTPDTVENELLRSYRDIDLIKRNNEFDNVNSFILAPGSVKNEKNKRIINNLIGDYKSSLSAKGITTFSSENLVGLTTNIHEWFLNVA